MAPWDFSDDAALVTGAANGIGRGIATALAKAGARVMLADVAADKGAAAFAALHPHPLGHRFVAADLATRDAADRLFEQAVAAFGRVSIFVHSASPLRREAETVFAVSDEAWEQMIAVNLRAGFRLGRAAGKHMVENNMPGRMLFVTSLHAESPRNLPHYSAAKAGTTMVMKELARAFGPRGIRVNAIAPGAIAGGGFVANPAMAERIAMGRLGTPEDIAPMALALLANEISGYVTGTTVVVDGGISLHNWIAPPTEF